MIENLTEVCPLVPRHGADFGLILDPDADRLALIDEKGRYIGEELTLALAVLFRLKQEPGPVVINMSTSRRVEDIARQFGCVCHRSAVGEANVVEKMRQVGAVIGGEGNGGVIDPRVGWVRDPFIGIGLILNLLAETGRKLSELVANMPDYHIVKAKQAVDAGRLPELFANLESGGRRQRPTTWTACVWIGRTAGFMYDRATRSRLSASLPRPRGRRKRKGCAGRSKKPFDTLALARYLNLFHFPLDIEPRISMVRKKLGRGRKNRCRFCTKEGCPRPAFVDYKDVQGSRNSAPARASSSAASAAATVRHSSGPSRTPSSGAVHGPVALRRRISPRSQLRAAFSLNPRAHSLNCNHLGPERAVNAQATDDTA